MHSVLLFETKLFRLYLRFKREFHLYSRLLHRSYLVLQKKELEIFGHILIKLTYEANG